MDPISSVAIEVALEYIIKVMIEEYKLIRDLEEDAEQLQKTLGILQAYLSDAENKSISQNAVKIWLRELEVVAFDADNVLDEFSYHLLHKKVRKMMSYKRKALSWFLTLNNSTTRPRNMALKIKEINAGFEFMTRRATALCLQISVANAPTAPLNASTETNSFTRDPIFIGRDDQVSELVKKLIHFPQEEIFSILAIVGMGGMGKTTLTRRISNHQNVKDRFGSLIWVHVSQIFDPINLFKKILLGYNTDGVGSEESVLRRLQEAWKGRNYLLVLDDVWNEDLPKWEHFINSISGVTSTKGNGIIITTRSRYVASLVRPLHIHPLKGLSDEDCWAIIKAKAFDDGDVPLSGFQMIGREIAKRCQYLPLAANVVGGVLRCKSEEEWRTINEKWISGGGNISKVLKLSYDYLPSPSLKMCFTYCSIFPKGMEIKRQEVIEQWIAEGFLQGDEMQAVGNNFLNVLLHNSLLQYLRRDAYTNDECYVMHDLVHDMASSILGHSNSADGSIPVRYLFLKEESAIPEQVAEHLRTLLLDGHYQISLNMLENLKYLHVLTLGGFNRVKELPTSIRKMIHLRNLNISNTWIEKLPDWICELYHLQTLRAENDNFKELPSTLKYLINLRHLHTKLNLQLPAEIGRLICLQTLRHFRVKDKKGYLIEELGSLNNLKGELWISNLEKVHGKEEALKANIFQKPNLFDLYFVWDRKREEGETDDKSVLEGLQPHPNLKKLGISGFKGKRFPLWSEKMAVPVRDGPQGSNWVPLNNLVEIALKNCEECVAIPELEHLPNLKSLLLEGLKEVRFINSSFKNLTLLTIGRLLGLECLPDWLFYRNHTLLKLTIWNCPKLRELPDGLDTLNSLVELTIGHCQNLGSIGNPSGRAGQSQGILRELRIEECGGLLELPRQMMESWAPSLEILELVGLSSLENLPVLIDCFAKSTRLKELVIVGVPKLMAARTVESWDLGSLRRLEIDVGKEWTMESSVAIAETVNGILQGCCNTLDQFILKGSENWEWLPQSIQHLIALSYLKIENSGIEELPQWFGNFLLSLEHLSLVNCKKLRYLPGGDALQIPSNLRGLEFRHCPELSIDYDLYSIPHLHVSGA